MAAVTAGVIAGGTAIAQTVSGISNARKAQKAIDNFQRQELKNPFENIRISTLKSDQQTEANNVNLATSVNALQRAGTRAILGGLPRINQQNILLQQQISQDLERQELERQRLIASGEERIRAIQEGREERALQGLGQQLQTGRQDTFSGLKNLTSATLAFGGAIGGAGGATPQGTGSVPSSAITSQISSTDLRRATTALPASTQFDGFIS